ncbi:MAG: hypothetical protein KatS3mg117_1551 [Geminicoccaceae bacterium]|jgi:hypothetical protein|nr:MAG: hypothetical protein KatS3mg117_1551 [Geminicoccaceae bacterium]
MRALGLAKAISVLATLAAGGVTAEAQGIPVDLELVLAVDVSRSMDLDEQELQRQGYVDAITAPEVIQAIRAGAYRRIALTYVEWAGPSYQQVVVPWRLIEDRASAEAFAAELAEAPLNRERWTSISSGLRFAAERFAESPYRGLRRVIDVSGDGANNSGPPIEPVRDWVLAQDIVINGLPIMLKEGNPGFGGIKELDIYYEDCVIGGPGSFVIPVREREQFAPAIRQKLALEVAGRTPELLPAAVRVREKRIDCTIGERLRMQWMDR